MSRPRQKKRRGLTLLELLIAGAIGAVVLLGILSLYLATAAA
jgi:Tfp pilus assembly protein PilW